MFKFLSLLFIPFLSVLLLVHPVNSRNILLVTTDDMSATIFDKYPSHPFFDSANVYNAISSQPVCGPARAAILTGRRPDSTKIYNFETYLHDETIFSYFKNKGYDTFVTGKVFHTLPADQNKQFEYSIGELTSPRVCLSQANSGCPNNDFYCSVKTSEDQCSINNVTDFFKSRVNKQTNWIAGVGFHRPHLLLTIATKQHSTLCERYVNDLDFSVPDAYQTNTQKVDFMYSLSNIQHTSLMYTKVPINGVFRKMGSGKIVYPSQFFVNKNGKTIRQIRQAYCDSSTETINNFLKIVDEMHAILPSSVDDTDIIFVGDHGFQIGERGILGKNTLYPEATNIPLFFKIAGETTKRPVKTNYVSQMDIFPSLIQLHSESSQRFLRTTTNFPTSSPTAVPQLDGVSLFGNKVSVPISQYPRCQSIGTIQIDDCTNGENSCVSGLGRAKITYMGYLTILNVNGVTYRFSEWFKFNEERTCGWPSWTGMPPNLVNNLGSWPVWNVLPNSSTDFSTSYFQELYTIDQNGLINSSNLVTDPKYSVIIKQMDQIIKNNHN